MATGAAVEFCPNPPLRPPAQGSRPPKHARSACEPHRRWIEEQVRLGPNGMAIYQDLVERFEFTHKYNSVKRFVRGLKKKDPRQYERLEFLPGEKAKVDYGIGAATLHRNGKYRRPRLFVMTLKYSGRAFRKEKPYLEPLALVPFRYFEQKTHTVYDDGTIQVDNAYYGGSFSAIV